MIKPVTLWALFKSCTDSKWLGDVCRALGKQDVELDFGQKMMIESITQDSAWMDERIEDQRARWVERQRKCRARKDSPEETTIRNQPQLKYPTSASEVFKYLESVDVPVYDKKGIEAKFLRLSNMGWTENKRKIIDWKQYFEAVASRLNVSIIHSSANAGE